MTGYLTKSVKRSINVQHPREKLIKRAKTVGAEIVRETCYFCGNWVVRLGVGGVPVVLEWVSFGVCAAIDCSDHTVRTTRAAGVTKHTERLGHSTRCGKKVIP